MVIRADEITKYMKLHGVDKLPLEAVTVDVPATGPSPRLAARKLPSSRIVATGAYITKAWGAHPATVRLVYTDAEYLRREHPVTADFEFNLLTLDGGNKMLSDLAQHNSGLEARFRRAVEQYTPAIQEKLKAAAELIGEAEELSDKHGVPFRPKYSLAGFSMSYIPDSLKQIFSTVDSNLVYSLTNASGSEYDGWQSSQTC